MGPNVIYGVYPVCIRRDYGETTARLARALEPSTTDMVNVNRSQSWRLCPFPGFPSCPVLATLGRLQKFIQISAFGCLSE
jgi:hypothetical protein